MRLNICEHVSRCFRSIVAVSDLGFFVPHSLANFHRQSCPLRGSIDPAFGQAKTCGLSLAIPTPSQCLFRISMLSLMFGVNMKWALLCLFSPCHDQSQYSHLYFLCNRKAFVYLIVIRYLWRCLIFIIIQLQIAFLSVDLNFAKLPWTLLKCQWGILCWVNLNIPHILFHQHHFWLPLTKFFT